MAVTQYIGARYVPLIDGEWSRAKTYEPLTVVLYQGNSYTSRQAVPRGIDIQNETYWAPTGNYNAQVELYRREAQQAIRDVDIEKSRAQAVEAALDMQIETVRETYARVFNTVADMKAAHLVAGMICRTNGFYSVGDGGSAWYVISSEGEANEMDVIECGNVFANLVIESEMSPEQFGAKGDGIADDTNNINRMLNLLSNVVFNGKTYMVSGVNGIFPKSNQKIDLGTSTIKRIPDTATGKSLIRLSGVENVIITNGNIIGDIESRGITSGAEVQCSCFDVVNCNNINIKDVKIAFHAGDGIRIGVGPNYTDNTIIQGCVIHDCHRHGIGAVGLHNSTIRDCEIYNVRWLDGIDFETGYPDNPNENVNVIGCYIHDLGGYSYSAPNSIINNDCINLNVINCQMDVSMQLQKEPSNVINCQVEGIILRNIPEEGTVIANSMINEMAVYSSVKGVVVDNCEFGLLNGGFARIASSTDTITYPDQFVKLTNCHLVSSNINDAFHKMFYGIVPVFELIGCVLDIKNGAPIIFGEKIQTISNCAIKLHNSQGITNYSIVDTAYSGTLNLVENFFDALDITETTSNGFIITKAVDNYIVGNTILAKSALGGVYDGNAIRANYTSNETLTILNNNFPSYNKLVQVSSATVKSSGNILSSDLA